MPGTTPPALIAQDEPRTPEVSVARVLACTASVAAVCLPPGEQEDKPQVAKAFD